MNDAEQQFLNDLDKRLWTAADKLRANLNPGDYMHVVLGLVFLKYVSDAFKERREELKAAFVDPANDYYLGPDGADLIEQELEARDYYTEKNIFWVPALARWDFLKANAKVAIGTKLEVKNGKTFEYKFNGIGRLLDDALEAVEKENPGLKNVLDKSYARWRIDEALPGLIDLLATVPFKHESLHAKDILGHVYEYFLGQFASSEGKRAGEYYTPRSVVRLLVEMLEPYHGRIYDPCCGSGGMFVQSAEFVAAHGGKRNDISVYGQEYTAATWRLAKMNLAIRGIEANLGDRADDSFHRDLHPDLRADFVIANPPFNVSDWYTDALRDDPRWKYGQPPAGNGNYAWIQHFVYHLSPHGVAGFILANGSLSSKTSGEGEIRKNLVKSNIVDCIVALPEKLFFNAGIPVVLWFLAKNRTGDGFRERKNEVLFIDARKLGHMETRTLRTLGTDDIAKISGTYHSWRNMDPEVAYSDVAGFCKAVSLEEVAANDFVLTPGRYVGATEVEDDSEPIEEKIARLRQELSVQFQESTRLQNLVLEVLENLEAGT